jgi:hypothetical protein
VYLILAAFFVLLYMGLRSGEIRLNHAAICCALAIAGFPVMHYVGLHQVAYTAWLAAIDIYLVLKIFKGDIQIR